MGGCETHQWFTRHYVRHVTCYYEKSAMLTPLRPLRANRRPLPSSSSADRHVSERLARVLESCGAPRSCPSRNRHEIVVKASRGPHDVVPRCSRTSDTCHW